MRDSVMRRARIVAAVGASVVGVLACAPGGEAAVSQGHATAPNHKIGHSTSTNWAGYDVKGGSYKTVSARWTQPAVNCSVTPTGWSSFWVGLDGDGSNSVEQTGTEADCSSGRALYSAWYEMYPKYPKNFANPVSPGDRFTASVSTDGRGAFTLTISDTTKGWTQTTSQRLKSARLASAEIIAEAPSSSSGVLPLADFGTIGFTGATVNGAALTSTTPGVDPITMTTGSTVKATPSSISAGSFSVSWKHQ